MGWKPGLNKNLCTHAETLFLSYVKSLYDFLFHKSLPWTKLFQPARPPPPFFLPCLIAFTDPKMRPSVCYVPNFRFLTANTFQTPSLIPLKHGSVRIPSLPNTFLKWFHT